MGSRKPEIIIGLIGSIIGILVGFWIINYGDSVTDYIQTFTYLPGELGNELANLGWITLIASVVALIASLLISSTWLGCYLSNYRYRTLLRYRNCLDYLRNFNHFNWFNGYFQTPCSKIKILKITSWSL